VSSIAQILLDKWQGNTAGLKEDYRSKLEHGVWVVEFNKVDGTPAIMEATLDPKLLPPAKDGTKARPEQEHLLHVYAVDREGWRSFTVANVKSFYKKPEAL
jgi:hypothetical protein